VPAEISLDRLEITARARQPRALSDKNGSIMCSAVVGGLTPHSAEHGATRSISAQKGGPRHRFGVALECRRRRQAHPIG
jgi:hypothetical protein